MAFPMSADKWFILSSKPVRSSCPLEDRFSHSSSLTGAGKIQRGFVIYSIFTALRCPLASVNPFCDG
jgi:hypothetical protein